MRREVRWLVLALAVLLAALGAWQGTRLTGPEDPAATGSAAWGLVLLDKTDGVYVLAVIEGSEADAAGVQPGDYLAAMDDVPLGSSADLDGLLTPDADEIRLTLRRNRQQIPVILRRK